MSTKIREEQLDTITGTDSDTFQLNSGATIKNSSGAMKLCGSTVYAKNADDSDYANFRSRSLRVEMDYGIQCPNVASQSGTTAVWVTVGSMTSLYKSSSSSRRAHAGYRGRRTRRRSVSFRCRWHAPRRHAGRAIPGHGISS